MVGGKGLKKGVLVPDDTLDPMDRIPPDIYSEIAAAAGGEVEMDGRFCDMCGQFFTWNDPQDEGGLPMPTTCTACKRKKEIPVPDLFREAFKNAPDLDNL